MTGRTAEGTGLETLQARLRPILDLERAQGYRDRSLEGGLRTLSIAAGAMPVPGESAAHDRESAIECLGVYRYCSSWQRAHLVEALAQWCDGQAMPPCPLDELEAEDETHGFMSRPISKPIVPKDADLDSAVTVLHGIGARLAERLERLEIRTLYDVLHHFPSRYQAYENLSLDQVRAGQTVSVMGRVQPNSLHQFRFGREIRKSGVRARISDGTAQFSLTWWNRWVYASLEEGRLYHFYGQVDLVKGQPVLTNPQFQAISARTVKANLQLATEGRLPRHMIMPIYPLTEGVTNALLRRVVSALIKVRLHQRLEDELPPELRQRIELPSIREAVRLLHQPATQEEWRDGRRRIAFQDLYRFHMRLREATADAQNRTAPAAAVDPDFMARYEALLPFELTAEQRSAVEDLLRDIAQPVPARRMLRGETGAGKTVVITAALLAAADRGWQTALIAPTQLLARQHYESISGILDAWAATPGRERVEVDLLTGTLSGSQKAHVHRRIAAGTARIVVGTVALIQEAVQFRRLGLLVVDEEHRYGVDQRMALAQPWREDDGTLFAQESGPSMVPHLISMSATPIPRSLNQVLTGYVNVSEIRNRPAHRSPLRTKVRLPAARHDVYAMLRRHVARGRQAFIVYSQIDMGDEYSSLGSLEPDFEWLSRRIFPDLRLGKLHGRMDRGVMEGIMTDFRERAIDILVATTVIEVGIDVPNASMIVIENAERFGLAQLHQLRSRVGRGEHAGTCILMCGTTDPAALRRLRMVEETDSGFELAERDLELRGPGAMLGKRQSGFPELPHADFMDETVVAMIETCFREGEPESPSAADA